MSYKQYLILGFASAVVVNIILFRIIRRFRRTERYRHGQGRMIRLLQREEEVMLRLNEKTREWISVVVTPQNLGVILEILIIGVWATWISKEYLDFNPQIWPLGREVGVQLAPHDFWNQFRDCGICALWNSSINGGFPTLADPFSSAFHPLVMITTLLFGIVNGAKVATILLLWFAGLAQWGIARLFNARSLIRIWSGVLAVSGGHILGKLELGAFGVALSTSMATFTIFCFLNFLKTKSHRSMILLAISISLLLVSGHGYMQVGILTWLISMFLMLLSALSKSVKKKFMAALVLGLLLVSVVFLPILHFAPNIEKWTDLEGELSQKIEYIPINLIVRDLSYYQTEILSKTPFPYLSNIYIGWFPVILAVIGLSYKKTDEQKTFIISLSTLIFLALFMSSGMPFHWAGKILPFANGIRHTQLIAGLMVPPIIGIASFGLEELLNRDWPELKLSRTSGTAFFSIPGQWVMIIPMLFSVYACYDFNTSFIKVKNESSIYEYVETINLESSQWISPPIGDHWWVLPTIEQNLKITNAVYPWWWKGRANPHPYLEITSDSPIDGSSSYVNLSTQVNTNNQYAIIVSSGGQTPCPATSNGGIIVVICETEHPGRLIVKENRWVGWRVWRDGVETHLYVSDWLTVRAPAGNHTYIFRYIPWDVLLGLILTLISIVTCGYFLFTKKERLDQIFRIDE